MNRGIPTTTDITLTDQVLMHDGRNPDLASQVFAAVEAHYQATSRPSSAEAAAIVAFEGTEGFFSSAATRDFADGGAAPGLPPGETDAQRRGRKFGLVGGDFRNTANVERVWVIDVDRDGFDGDDDFETALPDLGRALITGEITDVTLFKIPTLRNISHTPPYFHDGSAKTLEDVVDHYQQFVNALGDICNITTGACDLSDQDKQDIVEFLQLL